MAWETCTPKCGHSKDKHEQIFGFSSFNFSSSISNLHSFQFRFVHFVLAFMLFQRLCVRRLFDAKKSMLVRLVLATKPFQSELKAHVCLSCWFLFFYFVAVRFTCALFTMSTGSMRLSWSSSVTLVLFFLFCFLQFCCRIGKKNMQSKKYTRKKNESTSAQVETSNFGNTDWVSSRCRWWWWRWQRQQHWQQLATDNSDSSGNSTRFAWHRLRWSERNFIFISD